MRLKLTRNGQFHPIHNFSHLLPPKHIIFGEISKICIPGGGGGYIGKCFEFFNFFKLFHTKVAQNDTQWPILPEKWLRLAPNSQSWSFCRFFYLFPQNEAQIDSEWLMSPDSQLFPSFATKASHFWRNLKNFHSWGSYISKFFEFFNFFKLFHTEVAQNDTQWPILPKMWLRLAPNGQFWSFCRFFYLFPQMRLRLTWNGQCHPIHNFSHLLPPKHLIFGEISKIFIPGGGVHQQNFCVFQLFQIISHRSGSKLHTMANFAKKVA